MVQRNLTTSVGLPIALALALTLALVSGVGSAQSGLFDGQGAVDAAADAAAGYYVDGSGAVDEATSAYDQAHAESNSQAHAVNDAYEQARDDAWTQANATQRPATPQCQCDELFHEIEQAGEANLAHSDRIEKTADVETDLVDAGADLSAGAQLKAILKDALNGIGDAFSKIGDVLTPELNAEDNARSTVHDAIHTDDNLRGEVMDALGDKQALPGVDSRIDGEFAADHAGSISTAVLGQAGTGLP